MITTLLSLEMVGCWLFDDAVDMTWTPTEIEVDTADYPGLTHAYFEAVMDTYGSGGSHTLQLVDEDGNVYATFNQSADEQLHRQRAEITLREGKHQYYCYTPETADVLELDWRTARILLELVDSEKARAQVPLFDGDQSTGGGMVDEDQNNWWAWGTDTYTEAYSYGGGDGTNAAGFRIFKLDQANWDTIDHWTLEVIGSGTRIDYPEDVGTLSAALFNVTKNVMVTGAELTFTEVAPTRKTIDFANDAENFDDGDEFELRIKYDGPEYGALYRSALYVSLDPAVKLESHLRIGTVAGGSTSAREDLNARWKYEPSLFPGETPFYWEVTAKAFLNENAILVYDLSTADKDIPGAIGTPATASGDWTDVDNARIVDAGLASKTLSTPNETSEVTLSDFAYDSPLPSPVVRSTAEVAVAVTGQNASMAVDGSYTGIIAGLPVLTVIHKAYAATYPTSIVITAKQPNNSTPTTFFIDGAYITVMGGEMVAESELTFGTGSRLRQRTADLRAYLTEDNRYGGFCNVSTGNLAARSSSFLIGLVEGSLPTPACLSVSATIDAATMTATGYGTGENATQWRVVRVSDSVVMDTGSGYSPNFEFQAEYGIQYQLQFAGDDDVWSETGCTFTFAIAPVVPSLPAVGSEVQIINPWVILRWSDDGGFTWSKEHWRPLGRVGEFKRRAVWNRLGRGRDRVYWVEITDPVKVQFIDAYIDLEPGTS